MSEVKLVVRDWARDISGTCHGSAASRAVAALSADPVTIEELEVAMERFMKKDPHGFFCHFRKGADDEPWDAGLVVIDLAARLVVCESSYFAPSRSGSVEYHNGRQCTDIEVHYDLSGEWMLSSDSLHWRGLARDRRRQRERLESTDVRAILYGRPLLEFLATECFAVFPQREMIAHAVRVKWASAKRSRAIGSATDGITEAINTSVQPAANDPDELLDDEFAPRAWPGQERFASPFYDTLKEIHARWLMTPREDLRGKIPRDILLAEHEHRMCDMQHRCDQWSIMQECPRGVDETSYAFRFGGFGTHELVKYYDLVRELLWSCWNQLTELAQSPNATRRPASQTVSGFLLTEVPRLEQLRESWLDSPDPDFDDHTPRSIIDRERARIPEAVSGRDAMIDPECPCCQMLAELPGPMFWHLDGTAMDQEFAFDIYHQTREEWDADQVSAETEEDDLEEHQANHPHEFVAEKPVLGSIWSRSFSIADDCHAPLGIRLFGLAGHLAELTVDLRELCDTNRFVERLNREFGNLREVLGNCDQQSLSTLVEPTVSRFTETLDDLAASYPDLEPKCCDLVRKVQTFLDPSHPQITDSFPDDDTKP